ncbi:MAG: hypothetical protein KatS3mg082_0680 [Nitrospiraceae bacterium]|nr:MAG: hypothetical protein KatS3mg082_0680 [Nitrospiraceae bacterium]
MKAARSSSPTKNWPSQVPSEYQGAVIEEIGRRRGELRHMKLVHADGAASEMHLEYHIPTRGIIGLKNVLLAKTRGTVIMHHVFKGYEPMDDRAPGGGAARIAGSRSRTGGQHGLRAVHDARNEGPCSSGPASRSIKAWSSGRTAAMKTWT